MNHAPVLPNTNNTQQEMQKPLAFEDALAELEQIVQRLEAGRVNLEDSLIIYERGEFLKKHCENLLAQAELKIRKIVTETDKNTTQKTAEPLEDL
jgi:exodeoxyribonuclease VII small subunit